MSREIRNVAVIGAGVMGHGIAQVFAMKGYNVNLVDVSEEILKKALQNIEWSLNKFVEKKRIRKEDAEAALSRIKTTVSYEEATREIDLMVEAVSENIDLKKRIFSKVDELAPPHAILASNTSTLSISVMGEATKRPEKVVGMHWFNPPQLMQLIEVVRGEKTSDETVEKIIELSKALGKTPIICKKDVRGFIVNRILGLVFNEAFWTYYRREATMEGIDSSVKYSGGFPMGWFELCDYVGLDIAYEVGRVLYEAYGERFKPCPEVIEPLVKEKKLGQKTGIGFYDWSKGRPRIPFELSDEYDYERSWAVAVNEAAWLIHDNVAEPESIDTGMKLGTGWPQGPCEYADKKGLNNILEKLKQLYNQYKMEMYNPCPLIVDYVNKGWIGKAAGRGFYKY
ncbi:MAG: 3-hydroxyacyl-CoA dehydrogenase [Thaumarchaeota archaeon]|nr:3-hydroxyacyl-CoA dehydrogenase [Candidatus Geocrenenecus arthurdayi]MCL7390760.1 3-hydroxyacyl-CoA dehydrogenase [Candidatus Geocrenenecus arthurdayi]MCL7396501.1 3-hydroxyacyl-CoA dehydrogenase [Candidatus Geocrenenecus arthurdayi]MCL7401573.1 3-hydroxyacyl-CoA dehydrogenase [Candidatus Geocrenenecus arthurdayi]MCL7402936.1 3-hydroxyacyl-CoA dehydrogenase [Candidatus Geocrenenecus arthurdayi]